MRRWRVRSRVWLLLRLEKICVGEIDENVTGVQGKLHAIMFDKRDDLEQYLRSRRW